MLTHRLRRWPSKTPALDRCILSAGEGNLQLLGATKTMALILVQLRYIVGFGLVEMAISTNPKPTMYRNLYENTGPGIKFGIVCVVEQIGINIKDRLTFTDA